jgi:hypothetical protein
MAFAGLFHRRAAFGAEFTSLQGSPALGTINHDSGLKFFRLYVSCLLYGSLGLDIGKFLFQIRCAALAHAPAMIPTDIVHPLTAAGALLEMRAGFGNGLLK